MKVGFTGTRNGMTDAQKVAFVALLASLKPTEFHHGDCVGADDEAANVADGLTPRPLIICHPPADEKLRAYNGKADFTRERKTHFARNRDIVNETEVLIACPPYATPIDEKTMGGTAYTVTYARRIGRPAHVIAP